MGWLKKRGENSLSMIPDGKVYDYFHLIFTDFISGHTANIPISSKLHQCQNADLHQDTRCYLAHTKLAI
jgi:hypothetical protein